MTKLSVDINADLGEGAGQDHIIMPLVSSCNIACGGHAGDEETMKEAVELATLNNVKIGAHPSYPDRENFGRINLEISDLDLQESVKSQLDSFYQITANTNQTVHHIKAHGALYNKLAEDEKTAEIYLNTISGLGIKPKLYVPFNSIIQKLAQSRFECLIEAFIDRAYNDDLTLVARSQANALHKTPEKAWNQLFNMATKKSIITISGAKVEINADTYCIHGDHPNAKQILEYIHQGLLKHNILLQK